MNRDDAELAYRRKRAVQFWTALWVNDKKRAEMVRDAILSGNDPAAGALLTSAGCKDPDLLIEQVRPVIEREDRVETECSDLVKLEARILRRVADALSRHYTEAYRSMGGPQDGDSAPSEFDADRAARDLIEEAIRVEDEALSAKDRA